MGETAAVTLSFFSSEFSETVGADAIASGLTEAGITLSEAGAVEADRLASSNEASQSDPISLSRAAWTSTFPPSEEEEEEVSWATTTTDSANGSTAGTASGFSLEADSTNCASA